MQAVADPVAVTLVLGGARAGKSTYAERCVLDAARDGRALYVATTDAALSHQHGDADMLARIDAHRAQRSAGWETIEAPHDLPAVLSMTRADPRPVLVDCLTLWLTNLMLAGRDIAGETARLLAAFDDRAAPLVLVANEVGLGIVPETPLGRRFRDEAGRLNQRVAARADQVVFVAAGLPLTLKGV